MSRLLGVEEDLPGQFTRYHRTNDGKFVIETVQDCEPIIERNKAQLNSTGDYRTFGKRGKDMYRVASVPLTLLHKWAREAGIRNPFGRDMDEILVRKLNDPDYKFLRTRPGRIAKRRGRA